MMVVCIDSVKSLYEASVTGPFALHPLWYLSFSKSRVCEVLIFCDLEVFCSIFFWYSTASTDGGAPLNKCQTYCFTQAGFCPPFEVPSVQWRPHVGTKGEHSPNHTLTQ